MRWSDTSAVIAFVLPTRDRPFELARTLAGVGALGLGPDVAEIVVVDNGSRERPDVPVRTACGARATLIELNENRGAAARNVGVSAADASRRWVVMLDDDSHPLPDADGAMPFVERLGAHGADVLAVMADIHLSPTEAGDRGREQGGLPEVPIGCGVAIRREAFEAVGGYDPSFGFYAEEYDLSAKLMGLGGRVEFDPAWRVVHHKTPANRDMSLIVERLVRNTAWVMQRYAPEAVRTAEVERVIARCAFIAEKERALAGFERGMAALEHTIDAQVRTPLTDARWDRFTGLAAVRGALAVELERDPIDAVSLVLPGKNAFVVERAFAERGVEVRRGLARSGVPLAIGTLSPGPMLDGLELLEPLGRRVIAPWGAASAGMRTARSFDRARDAAMVFV
ncbi:MAG: glycosyltransferase [Planctomycetota bacterium]